MTYDEFADKYIELFTAALESSDDEDTRKYIEEMNKLLEENPEYAKRMNS